MFDSFLSSLKGITFFFKNREPEKDDIYYVYEDDEFQSFSITYRVVTLDGKISFACNQYFLRVYFEDVSDGSCKHLKKRGNYVMVAGEKVDFWYCPDCKEDVGLI